MDMKVKVVDIENLADLLRTGVFHHEEVVFVRDAEGSHRAALVIQEGGGHNSLGGARSTAQVIEGQVLAQGDVPIHDTSYNWWRHDIVVSLPSLVEYVDERWGEWTPNYYKRYRTRYRWTGSKLEREIIPLYEEIEVDEYEEIEVDEEEQSGTGNSSL